ncbi:MAG: hypothetical protein K2J49_06770 [Muribaculaceae bacterium]|nr:hypothetical protein [Muribaculaceae bacterium]
MNVKTIPMLMLLALASTSCKPTESNYRAAYDAAQQKRKASDDANADMSLPAGGLLTIGGPAIKVVNGDSVFVTSERIRFEGGLENEMRKWNVAVAKFKMPTNCAAMTENLFSEGYKSFYVKNTEGAYYVIAGSFDTLEEAALFAHDYASKKNPAAFTGLPDSPVIIEK